MPMAYFIRFFGAGKPPRVETIAQAAVQLDPLYEFDRIGEPLIEVWRQVEPDYRSLFGHLEVVARGEEVFETDIAEFREGLARAEGDVDAVRQMLDRCDFIASVEVFFVERTMEQTRSGLEPIWDWLASTHPGLLHVDDEGFYRDDTLIASLR
jgi:hypothetical protein